MAGSKKKQVVSSTDSRSTKPLAVTSSSAVAVRLRGSLPSAPASARGVAALTENPGCERRRVIDAASVPSYVLAERVGFPSSRGQSPFAIASGNSFEERLKKRSGYSLLVEALAPFVDISLDNLRVEDLGDVGRISDAEKWKQARVLRTNEVLTRIASGEPGAPQIVDHPMLTLDLVGSRVYLEPDALAYRSGGQLELVEVKSFPIIDRQADPAKVAAMAGQSAVYVLALRETLGSLGFDPDMVKWSVILVAPRNFGRVPTAHRIPLKKKAQSIRRVLSNVSPVDELLQALPASFTLDADPQGNQRPDSVARKTALALETIPARYVPSCLSSCDMAGFCRDEASGG